MKIDTDGILRFARWPNKTPLVGYFLLFGLSFFCFFIMILGDIMYSFFLSSILLHIPFRLAIMMSNRENSYLAMLQCLGRSFFFVFVKTGIINLESTLIIGSVFWLALFILVCFLF